MSIILPSSPRVPLSDPRDVIEITRETFEDQVRSMGARVRSPAKAPVVIDLRDASPVRPRLLPPHVEKALEERLIAEYGADESCPLCLGPFCDGCDDKACPNAEDIKDVSEGDGLCATCGCELRDGEGPIECASCENPSADEPSDYEPGDEDLYWDQETKRYCTANGNTDLQRACVICGSELVDHPSPIDSIAQNQYTCGMESCSRSCLDRSYVPK